LVAGVISIDAWHLIRELYLSAITACRKDPIVFKRAKIARNREKSPTQFAEDPF